MPDEAPAATLGAYGRGTLPPEIRSRTLRGINGLDVHFIEAGWEPRGRPVLLLLHGYPEIAYSWRHVIPPLAAAGYHVIAPDMRGHGRTTGWSSAYDADPAGFFTMNLVRDAIALLFALGHRSVAGVLGHDAGSPVAAWAALTRPDIFRSAVMMSAPFPGPPSFPFDVENSTAAAPPPGPASAEIDAELAKLDPPREHYIRWNATPEANPDIMNAPQGLRDFLRAYYHSKSADWAGNRPERLDGTTGAELAKMPNYYIMRRGLGMAANVAPYMPSPAEIAACRWLPDADLDVYVEEYGRTGFQGGLQVYKRVTRSAPDRENLTHAGSAIQVPACFVAGSADWGTWQGPGAIEAMETRGCADFRGTHIVPGAGHWVQQEQPEAVAEITLRFLREAL